MASTAATKGKGKVRSGPPAATSPQPDTAAAPETPSVAETTEIAPADSDEQTEDSASQPSNKQAARLAQLKRLRQRKQDSARANSTAAHREYTAARADPTRTAAAARQREQAEAELARLEMEERGEDFERRRAWDWTVEEAQAWDAKLRAKAERARAAGAGADSAAAAEREYLRDLRGVEDARQQQQQPGVAAGAGLKEYTEQKIEALRKRGMVAESADGEVIGYDMDGGSESLAAFSHRPDKKAVDTLVSHLNKEDEQRAKRRKKNDDGDESVSYINEMNKKFNQRLSRHYDKYTKDIRDALERGTAL